MRNQRAAANEAPVDTFAAVQHFGQSGRMRHFSLQPPAPSAAAAVASAASSSSSCAPADAAASFLVVHWGEEARRDAAAQAEKQALLSALFSAASPAAEAAAAAPATGASSSSSSASSLVQPAPPPATPFSPRWYPLASVLSHLLPQHYPSSVTSYYLSYSKWMFVGAVFGTASSVLSMQCLLYSVGVGGTASIPAAAAIAWVLKDGVGQFGGMLFASLVATRFDVSPLRYRMGSAIVLDCAVALEMLTPLVPHLFLPLAALANTGKNIAWLGAAASRAAIHRSLLRRENLADVTAKSGSQTILASLVGTALGIGISMATGSNTAAILVCFAALSTSHLIATYRALRDVVINQLHDKRVEKLAAEYVLQYLSHCAATSSSSAASSAPTFPLSLSSPAALQRSEPLFFRLRASTSEKAGGGFATRRSWARCSSVDTAPRFERLVEQVLRQSSMHLGRDHPLAAAGADAPSNEAVYAAWVAQFASLPFIASLQLLRPDEPLHPDRSTAGAVGSDSTGSHWSQVWNRLKTRAQSMWAQRSEGGGGGQGRYASVPSSSSGSDSPSSASAAASGSGSGLPRLHVRLLFKSGCSSEQLLLASLYTTFLRMRWAELTANKLGAAATDDATAQAALLGELHQAALALLRFDAENGAQTLASSDAASSMPSAAAAAQMPTPPRPVAAELIASPTVVGAGSSASLPPPPPVQLPSRFVHELRAAGFQTELHFVEDDNPVRIEIHSDCSDRLSCSAV